MARFFLSGQLMIDSILITHVFTRMISKLYQLQCIANWNSFFIPCPLLFLTVAARIIANICVGEAHRAPGQAGGTFKSLSAL